jgi:hypothetical protein
MSKKAFYCLKSERLIIRVGVGVGACVRNSEENLVPNSSHPRKPYWLCDSFELFKEFFMAFNQFRDVSLVEE